MSLYHLTKEGPETSETIETGIVFRQVCYVVSCRCAGCWEIV